MYYRTWLPGGTLLKIIVPESTRHRLSRRCFRERGTPLAGNFRTWTNEERLFNNQFVRKNFILCVQETCIDGEGTYSFTIECGWVVGWESTDELENHSDAALERFKPNNHCSAFRIKKERTDILAPTTKLVTFVIQFKRGLTDTLAIVRSIYPGHDIGELDGDITDREKRVFFDWSHPGEPKE